MALFLGGYSELRIELHVRDDGLYAARLSFLDDVLEGQFTLAASPDRVEQIVGSIWNAADLRPVRKGQRETLNPVIELGQALYAALFSGPRETFFRQCQERAAAAGRDLRLQFALADARAAALPWEFLHDSRDFLALSGRTPVVRCLADVPGNLPPAQTGLRVLALTADVETSRGRWKAMTHTLYDDLRKLNAHLTVTIIDDVTLPRLREAIVADPYDVVHFCGHADAAPPGFPALFFPPDPAASVEYNALSRPDARTTKIFVADGTYRPDYTYVGAEQFAQAIEPARDLKLICLDACNAAGLTYELARQTRIPAVYGIHSIISDESADSFIRGFLTQLLAGQTLTQAATEGRQEIDRRRPGSREWGLPVLYTGFPDGQLVQSTWQAAYSGSNYGGSKGLPEAAPAVPGATVSRERQKLETWLSLKRKNLQALEEQLAASSYASPDAQAQAASLREDIARLEAQLAQTP